MRAALALLVAASLPAQASARLFPVADATTSADQPTANYGGAPELTFGKDFTSTPSFRVWFTRGHVLFDFTSVNRPPPVKATFWWYQTRSSAAGCLNVATHRVTSPWAESTVTWNTNPSFDPAAVSTTCVGDSFALGWKSFDVTALVRGWMTSQYPNLGLVIRDNGEISAGAARPGYGSSREGSDPLKWPYVELDWSSAFGSGCSPATVPVLSLASGAPSVGTTMTLAITSLPPLAVTTHLVGISDQSWKGASLPYAFTLLGQPGCKQLVSAEAVVYRAADGAGALQVSFAIQPDPALLGLRVFHQAGSYDAQMRLYFTNGLAQVLY